MGSALTSCAGARSGETAASAAPRRSGKRGRRSGSSGAPTASSLHKLSMTPHVPQQGVAPDVLPRDIAGWRRNGSGSLAGSSFGGSGCSLSSSPSSSCGRAAGDGGSGRGVSAAADDDDFCVAHSLMTLSITKSPVTTAVGRSSALCIRSTVDLVKDISESRLADDAQSASDDGAAIGCRGSEPAVDNEAAAAAATSQPSLPPPPPPRSGVVRFHIVPRKAEASRPAAATTTTARLSRSASEAFGVAFPRPQSLITAACPGRPATGDFSHLAATAAAVAHPQAPANLRRQSPEGAATADDSGSAEQAISTPFRPPPTAAAGDAPSASTLTSAATAASLSLPTPSPSSESPGNGCVPGSPATDAKPETLTPGEASPAQTPPPSGNGEAAGGLAAASLRSLPSPTDSPSSSVSKRPRKPPRTYSYRASTQPKRISHTTEEFVAMWDELRRSLSRQTLAEGANGESSAGDLPSAEAAASLAATAAADGGDDGCIYMNHYATRARGWQILSLAQDALAQRLDARTAVDGLFRLGHMDAEQQRALADAPGSDRERTDALIDAMLEKGDACYDAFRTLLRNAEGGLQMALGRLLDTLDEVFRIGASVGGRNFSLTTKHCTVSCGGGGAGSDGSPMWLSLERGLDARGDVGDEEDDGDIEKAAGDDPTCVLDLYNENFGDASCSRLAAVVRDFNVIAGLRLAKNGITAAGVRALAPALEMGSRLRLLNLRLNPIGNDGLAVLAEAMSGAGGGCSLVELVLSHTGLTSGCGRILADALQLSRGCGGSSLRVLDISHNDIGDDDCAALAAALCCKGGALRRLNLRHNSFGPRGCASLFASLGGGGSSGHDDGVGSLASLDVSQNRVLDDGARAMAAALASPRCSLRELYADGCGVTAAGCAALSAALLGSDDDDAGGSDCALELSSLRKLSLSHNPIADDGLRCLSEALAAAGLGGGCRRSSLRSLRVDMCGGSVEALGGLARTLHARNRSLEVLSGRSSYNGRGSVGGRGGDRRISAASSRSVFVEESPLDDASLADVCRAREAVPGRKIAL